MEPCPKGSDVGALFDRHGASRRPQCLSPPSSQLHPPTSSPPHPVRPQHSAHPYERSGTKCRFPHPAFSPAFPPWAPHLFPALGAPPFPSLGAPPFPL
eukprot:356172-Chlamydomonas_euryale.AAC.2